MNHGWMDGWGVCFLELEESRITDVSLTIGKKVLRSCICICRVF